MANKPKITIPPELLDLQKLKEMERVKQMRKLEEEEMKRFSKIADKIIEILIEEAVLVSELPRVIQILTGKVNKKIEGARVDTILKLD